MNSRANWTLKDVRIYLSNTIEIESERQWNCLNCDEHDVDRIYDTFTNYQRKGHTPGDFIEKMIIVGLPMNMEENKKQWSTWVAEREQ